MSPQRNKAQKQREPAPANTGVPAPPPVRRGRLTKRILVLGCAALASLAVAAALALTLLSGGDAGPDQKTAAIVDQLSLTAPNPEFPATATATLEKAGYAVDYFPGDRVTVDFYRELPAKGYDLLILRGHSARLREEFQGVALDEVILFTNEPWSDKRYLDEQNEGRLAIARYTEEGDRYFGIAPEFIQESMEGSFDATTIVLMGCEGLGSEKTADAFVAKGAESIISWDGLVSATHTDAATEELLDRMLLGRLPAKEAVAETMASVGPDPTYGSELRLLTVE